MDVNLRRAQAQTLTTTFKVNARKQHQSHPLKLPKRRRRTSPKMKKVTSRQNPRVNQSLMTTVTIAMRKPPRRPRRCCSKVHSLSDLVLISRYLLLLSHAIVRVRMLKRPKRKHRRLLPRRVPRPPRRLTWLLNLPNHKRERRLEVDQTFLSWIYPSLSSLRVRVHS
jgi:hypothetical protein